jgi:hypothetical protein
MQSHATNPTPSFSEKSAESMGRFSSIYESTYHNFKHDLKTGAINAALTTEWKVFSRSVDFESIIEIASYPFHAF